jgi:hypothetical protein
VIEIPLNIKVTVSMYVNEKLIIGGKFFDEQVNDYIGMLNICQPDDEILFDSPGNPIFLQDQVNTIVPIREGKQALIG